jgi:hypothetical protein
MKRFLPILILLAAPAAHAYEYKLQFTPQGGALGLDVAGYEFSSDTVIGDCSYYTVSAGSGRGGHSTRTNHYSTCTWDLFGNLISMTPGAPQAPAPLTETGTETVYAASGASQTGHDSRGFGFVNTPSSHYSWQTANGGYADIPYAVDKLLITLISDGDFPMKFEGATVVASVSGSITPSPGVARVGSTTCKSPVAVGSTCTVTVFYNPTHIACTPDIYGYAYTRISLALVTDAGSNPDFIEGFTVTGVPVCDD